MKRAIFILILSLLVLPAYTQQVVVNGSIGRRELTWDDFTGVSNGASPFYAQVYWNIRYRYKGVRVSNDTAYLQDFAAELLLDPEKTWSKKEFQEPRLLKHEQGHFDLGRLCMLEFLQRINETTFYRTDVREKVTQLFGEVLKKYRELGLKYDEESKHYHNKRKQREWDAFFKEELKRFGE